MKKAFLLLLFCLMFPLGIQAQVFVFAQENLDVSYLIYRDDGSVISEQSFPMVGDQIILPSLHKYEIVEVDDINRTARANMIGFFTVDEPEPDPLPYQYRFKNAKVGMYMTHNAESYELGDGYSSIYGVGGIHDVAKKLKDAFQSMNVAVVLDETLHIPHDSAAYARSGVTAQKILSSHAVGGLFDIHRDGVPRSLYYTTNNGSPRSKIRIVIGKASTNFAQTQNLAVLLMHQANELHPWLFLDIYLASGHYNQSKSKQALLFEMGTYLIEKDLVLQSCKPLAEVIALTMFELDTDNSAPSISETPITTDNSTAIETPIHAPQGTSAFALTVGFVSLAFCVLFVMLFLKAETKPKRKKYK